MSSPEFIIYGYTKYFYYCKASIRKIDIYKGLCELNKSDIIDTDDPCLRIERFAKTKIRGVSTNDILFIALLQRTYFKLSLELTPLICNQGRVDSYSLCIAVCDVMLVIHACITQVRGV